MGKRRDGREAAIQFLFSRDLQGEQKPEDAEVFWTLHSAKASTRAYAESLIKGVIDHQEEIDGHIIKVFDTLVHSPVTLEALRDEHGRRHTVEMDQRSQLCRRPTVVVGGELRSWHQPRTARS